MSVITQKTGQTYAPATRRLLSAMMLATLARLLALPTALKQYHNRVVSSEIAGNLFQSFRKLPEMCIFSLYTFQL